jgi:phage baseplate assembly protein W
MEAKDFGRVIEAVLSGPEPVRRATLYVSPKMVVKATRRHKPRVRAGTVELVVTIGRPNYAEREFIKAAVKAGERFPIEKVQLRFWPRGRNR